MHRINVFSPNFDPCDSYGRLAIELAQGFEHQGLAVNRIGKMAPKAPIVPTFGGFLLGYPTGFYGFGSLASAGRRVALTMFESSKLPELWAENLNLCDGVIVPAQFLVDVFRNSGVQIPIHVVPLGISKAFLNPIRRQRRAGEPFTILTIGDRGRRKGWDAVIHAFHRAFGDDINYRLVLKTRGANLSFANPNIEVIEADYSDDEMADLYRRCHVMAFATHGEGFGLPPREFAATGGVAIATDWGGTADDIDQWGVSLDHTMEPAFSDHATFAGVVGQWANPGVEHLESLLKKIVADFDWYAEFGMIAAEFVAETYRWSAFADQCAAIYQQVEYGNRANSH